MARTYNFEKVELIPEYALDPNNGLRLMKDHLTLVDAKTLFPKFFERYNAIGWPDDKCMSVTASDAAWEDYIWGTSGLPFIVNGVWNISGSHGHVYTGPGMFGCSTVKHWAFGKYSFHGTHPYYGSAGVKAGSTELVLLDDMYIDDPTLKLVIADLGTGMQQPRIAFGSTTIGKDGAQSGYNESAQVGGVCITCKTGNPFKSGIVRVGAMPWDMGSNSYIENLRMHGFDIPVMCVRGTPARFGTINSFNAYITPFMAVGCAQNSIDVGFLECDDAPNAYMMRPGYGREAGMRGRIGFIKIEGGVTPLSRGPWQPTAVGDHQGQWSMDIGEVNNSHAFMRNAVAFRVSSKLQNGDLQVNSLKVGGLTGYNYDHLIHNIDSGELISSPGDNVSVEFSYGSNGEFRSNMPGLITRRKSIQVGGVAKLISPARLGGQRWDDTAKAWLPPFDYVAGTPVLDYTAGMGTTPPPVVTPVPVLTSIMVTLSQTTAPIGTAVQATAIALDQNGMQMTINLPQLVWVVVGPATVQSNGIVTGNANGTVTVSASYMGKSGSATLAIAPAVVTLQDKWDFTNKPAQASPANLTASPGQVATAQQSWERAAITGGKLVNTNGNARYTLPTPRIAKRIVLNNVKITSEGYITDKVHLAGGRWWANGGTDLGVAPALNTDFTQVIISLPSGMVTEGLLAKAGTGFAMRISVASIELHSA